MTVEQLSFGAEPDGRLLYVSSLDNSALPTYQSSTNNGLVVMSTCLKTLRRLSILLYAVCAYACVCMCACVRMCVHVCVCRSVCPSICLCLWSLSVYVVCLYVYMCICVYNCIHTLYVYMHGCMYVCINSVCICLSLHLCVIYCVAVVYIQC